ncbi:NAD(P)-binding domain-containing protein [Shouchella miscanthi]|uniref:NAD(P)-binding domain-containing protein n=1 Tax=Shouchella miscanthi TaxID=2598861 RepID=A0ABU6NLN4_9BACI|nr:NAD(P)-binding domain-containing protein [Shouchella miscanthi]
MIGFIGFGEAAYEMAKGLTQEGVTGIIAYDPLLKQPDMSLTIEKKMTAVGVTPCSDAKEVAMKRSLLIAAVPAQFALAACEAVEEDLTAAHLYVDVSASSPTVKKTIAEKVAKSNGKSVDAAMLGPLTVNQHKVPMFISGDGAHVFKKQLDPYGMNITVVSE